ncbi:MAG: hypothetical protein RR012_08325 [Oscillospiraceae bacterium]
MGENRLTVSTEGFPHAAFLWFVSLAGKEMNKHKAKSKPTQVKAKTSVFFFKITLICNLVYK